MTFSDRYGGRVEAVVEFAPSVGWLGLMLLPLAFQYPDLHPTGRSTQLTLVSAIALLLFLADLLCFSKATTRAPAIGHSLSRHWLTLTGLFFLLPAAAHLYLMPNIPLLAGVFDNNVTEDSLTLLRLESAKLLDVPLLVKYLFNWTLVVFAPVYIVVALFTGFRRQALFGLIIASSYAVVTLAKLPLALLWVTCGFVACVMPGPVRRSLCLGLVGSVLLGFGFIGILFSSGSLAHLKNAASHLQSPVLTQMNPDDPRRALTYGDNFRFGPDIAEVRRSKLETVLEYVVYRAWLTPSDVSNRWYQYFTYVKKEPLGLRSFFPQRNATADAPSREVGIWAYRARFPHKYWDTINAYASFDADAFAHGGIFGVALATTILLAARIGAAFLVTSHPVGLASYGVLLCVIAILPSSASLQAIFGANGLFIVLIALLAIRLFP